jgi:hypothetical protein
MGCSLELPGWLLAAATAVAVVLGSATVTLAKVTSVSPYGEATVYISRDFSVDFDLAYAVTMKPFLTNASSTQAGVLILSSQGAQSVYIGVQGADLKHAVARAFTSTVDEAGKNEFKDLGACGPTCHIELKGDETTIHALVNGVEVNAWPRSKIGMIHPYVQINGEVPIVGDKIDARFTPEATLLAGVKLPPPSCAFTTQGVEPTLAPSGTFTMVGSFVSGGRVTYLAFADGRAMDTCP